MSRIPYYGRKGVQVYHGHVLDVLQDLPAESVNCAVTSPPYWGLRDYKLPVVTWDADGGDRWLGSLGLEPTPELYVQHIVQIFREVRWVLYKNGVIFINLGDSYTGGGGFAPNAHSNQYSRSGQRGCAVYGVGMGVKPQGCLKPKDLVGIPWRIALALQSDGWYLRSDIIWHKPNPMPESVTDRPTKSHEYVFLLSKSAKYWYNADAVKEPGVTREVSPEEYKKMLKETGEVWYPRVTSNSDHSGGKHGKKFHAVTPPGGRNLRSVWTIPTQATPEAHFATYPEKLVEPCIKAGCPPDGVVLDPFLGSGTTAIVAYRLGRKCIGIELSQTYLDEIAIPKIDRTLSQDTFEWEDEHDENEMVQD